jgi:hypothetical protein
MKPYIIPSLCGLLLCAPLLSAAGVVHDLQQEYTREGAGAFSAAKGQSLWNTGFVDVKSGQSRSCALCHSDDLTTAGEHHRTGKAIEPMAPSVNAERLTEPGKIEKWFKRNCKWTLGRECTPQEKGDLLSFIRSQ